MADLLATSANGTARVVQGTAETGGISTLEHRCYVCRAGGCRQHSELVVVVVNRNGSLERGDKIRIGVDRVEAADHRLPAHIVLREVLEHPMSHFRVWKRLANMSELLVHDHKMLEVIFHQATNVWVILH